MQFLQFVFIWNLKFFNKKKANKNKKKQKQRSSIINYI